MQTRTENVDDLISGRLGRGAERELSDRSSLFLVLTLNLGLWVAMALFVYLMF